VFHPYTTEGCGAYEQLGAAGVLVGGLTEMVVLFDPRLTLTLAPERSGSSIVQVTALAGPAPTRVVPASNVAPQSTFFQVFIGVVSPSVVGGTTVDHQQGFAY